MSTIQEYFNQQYQNDSEQVYLEGDKIGEIGGKELIIKDFNKLQYIYISDLPNLTKLTIKDCEELKSLELHLDKEIEMVLDGDFSKLKNIKTISTRQQPIIINQNNQKEGFCFGCFFNAITIIGLVVLTGIIIKLSNKINELRTFIKELKKRLKLK